MEENNMNSVFFECQRCLLNEKKKVETYFRVRRKSGGGDCGHLTPVADNFYRISFRHQKDQQEVLKRSEHVIELADGPLVVRVRNSLPAPASSQNTTSTAPAESLQFIPDSTISPDNEENKLSPDEHLPSEMRECVEAEEHQEEEVPSASSSVQLHPEDSVLFKKSSQPDAVDEVSVIKVELDNPDGYICQSEESSYKYKGQQVRNEGMALSVAGLNIEEPSPINTKSLDVRDESSSLSLTNTEVASYSLCDGLQVVLCQGDITTLQSTGTSTGNHTLSGDPVGLAFSMDSIGQEAATGDSDGGPKGAVKVEIVQGTIETQQVDTLVSPMVGNDPLSTRVGNILNKSAGFQLTAKFRRKSGGQTKSGESVLVEGLDGLSSNAIFFLNLAPWDEDENGVPVEILRMGINSILSSCEEKGFGSVAFPVLGAGIALQFPDYVVARVLLEEIYKFEQNRSSSAPIVVRIVIHPSDEEAEEIFRLVQESLKYKGFTQNDQQDQNQDSTTRIVLLGKTGSGKSHLGNTILGEELFTSYLSSNSGTQEVQAESRSVNGRSLTLIDTPGFFDTEKSEEVLKPEIMRCITECSPGPHVFLIVLKVEKFTKQEQDVIAKILKYFSDDALNYAVLVFTHGDDLHEKKIEEFVGRNKNLNALLKKCGGRCHVFDNKHWNNNQPHDYRNNQFQLEALLHTIDKMVKKNGSCYTNNFLQHVEKNIVKYEEHIRETSVNLSPAEIRKEAIAVVSEELWIYLSATSVGVLLGAFLGAKLSLEVVGKFLKNPAEIVKLMKSLTALSPKSAGAGNGVAILSDKMTTGVTIAVGAVAGGAIGGAIGLEVAKEAKTPLEAVTMTIKAVKEKEKSFRTKLQPR